ncbi:Small auxin-up RNA protein [Dioscorea alata]|uniref:Small auxin-up RNA protein n=1 Tax=Dioscorea alata TaxID=55571 RepID=A0ACB7UL25_DIOAL|nr:Small auxin-up RNA protein [Dioscorea alata]
MKQLIRRLARVADGGDYEPLRSSKEPRERVPEGHVPVYVGKEMERFAVRAELLGRPAFLELLRRSAQEYGYQQSGVLRIPCPVPLFKHVLQLMLAAGGGFDAAEEIVRSLPEDFSADDDDDDNALQ